MSTNKRRLNFLQQYCRCSIEQPYNPQSSGRLITGYYRNSFNRFGDDLCEEITQYLSFKDKLRFECVSKHFKHCIYLRQYLLWYIKDKNKLHGSQPRPQSGSISDSTQQKVETKGESSETKSRFETLLKKCTNVNRIGIDNNCDGMTPNQLLRVIIDNCNCLKRISIFNTDPSIDNNLDYDTVHQFGIKFGKTLQSIHFCFLGNGLHYLLKYCPNIVTIHDSKLEDLLQCNISLPKLSKVRSIGTEYSTENMERFVERYRKTIKVFALDYYSDNCVDCVLKLSLLENLENLTLVVRNSDLFLVSTALNNLSVNSYRRIKYLHLEIYDSIYNYSQLLEAVNRFTQLKTLVLCGEANANYDDISVQFLRDCRHLLRLLVDDFLDDTFCDDIHTYLPKLAIVAIISQYEQITNRTVNSLAKLTELRAITVGDQYCGDSSMITHTAICDLVERCTRLRSMKFYLCPKIRHSTIFSLIEIAKRRRNINVEHSFYDCTPKYYRMIESAIQARNLPLNLKILFQKKVLLIKQA